MADSDTPDSTTSRPTPNAGLRLRRSTSTASAAPLPLTTSSAVSASAAMPRRRSSNLSDYSQDARDLLNPTPSPGMWPAGYHPRDASEAQPPQHQPTTSWDSLPLAFALLPAVGGLLVQGGSAFVTDLMLLGLGAIFLHWSVTQPWTWYHSAREIREEKRLQVASAEYAVDSESETDDVSLDEAEDKNGGLADVPEEEDRSGRPAEASEAAPSESGPKSASSPSSSSPATKKGEKRDYAHHHHHRRRLASAQAAALRELYRHEALALLSCFAAPVLGAYLLHAIRDHLTRPSEGLVSGYNLTIFLLGAELRPLRHLLLLVQSRTLHLQRVLAANPYREEEEARYRRGRAQEERVQNQTLADMAARLAQLEGQGQGQDEKNKNDKDKNDENKPRLPPPPPVPVLPPLRDLRASLQPELDMLARALRRTHKQQTLLEGQVASQLLAADERMAEALALARAAARQNRHSGQPGLVHVAHAVVSAATTTVEVAATAAWHAVLWTASRALAAVLYLPLQTAAALQLVARWLSLPVFLSRDSTGTGNVSTGNASSGSSNNNNNNNNTGNPPYYGCSRQRGSMQTLQTLQPLQIQQRAKASLPSPILSPSSSVRLSGPGSNPLTSLPQSPSRGSRLRSG